MKILSREFTRAEKILIAALLIILVALAYYQFVDKSVRAAIANADSEAKMIQTELDAVEIKLAEARAIQSDMEALEAAGELSWMSSYNNGKSEVAFLNDILAGTLKYSVSFSTVTRSGDQIRRSFTLQYQTPDYASAQAIMARLCASENRCLVSDVKCGIDAKGIVTMTQSATFYETMVGGEPDAGLPQDKAKANS